MDINNDIEEKLLFEGDLDTYDRLLEKRIKDEIQKAKQEREQKLSANKTVITDIKKIPPEIRFNKDCVYKVFNRKLKTETFVSGDQAENLIKYTDDYIVRFDHKVCG